MIKLKDKDDLFSKVDFKKPYSILTPIINLKKDKEIQEKLDKIRKKFKLDKYLEKETENGVNIDSLGRTKSFLDFLQYTNKKKNLNEYLSEEKNHIKEKKEKNIFNLLNKKKEDEERNNKSNSSIGLDNDENNKSIKEKNLN